MGDSSARSDGEAEYVFVEEAYAAFSDARAAE